MFEPTNKITTIWVVYKQFPGIRGELQGGVLEGFDLCFGKLFGQFSGRFVGRKRVSRKWSYVGLRNHRISMIPGSEPILLDLEKLFLLSAEQISKE